MNDMTCQVTCFRVALCRFVKSAPVKKIIHGVAATLLPGVPARCFDAAEEVEELSSADLVIIKIDAAQSLSNDLQMFSSLTQQQNAPYLFVIIKNSTLAAKIKVYQAGARDCLDFPVGGQRLEEALASAISNACGNIEKPTLDIDRLLVRSSRGLVHLSYFESVLLFRLNQVPGRVMCREDITNLLEKNNVAYDERTLEKFISRLRAKIKNNLGVDLILCVRGYGYRLAAGFALASHGLKLTGKYTDNGIDQAS